MIEPDDQEIVYYIRQHTQVTSARVRGYFLTSGYPSQSSAYWKERLEDMAAQGLITRHAGLIGPLYSAPARTDAATIRRLEAGG